MQKHRVPLNKNFHEKWHNIMHFLEILINHDILRGCCESGIKIDAQILKGDPFRTKSQQIYTPVKSMGLLP